MKFGPNKEKLQWCKILCGMVSGKLDQNYKNSTNLYTFIWYF